MTGTPIFNRANAPTAMPDTAPFSNALEYLAFEAASDGGRITQAILESSARSETPLRERTPIGFGVS